ncbi:unnamed protein product [Meganyctiphanes norvegica]|uniref:Uncharacterized protein n=1 Tax=Meganyctiphanes norvegica TaxID=48144 RepID=A0AAV2RUN6_MEGNR
MSGEITNLDYSSYGCSMDSLMTTSELKQNKISHFFTSDHTRETPHHADDLDCDFEGFHSDSHTFSMPSMSGEITNLDYSSDATTVSFNTLKLEADDDCSDGCSTSELKQKKIFDLEAVDDCSDGCSMDSHELVKLDEKVLAGYIRSDDTESLDLVDCSDCSMDSLDKKRVLEAVGSTCDATTDSCESLHFVDC